MSINPGLPNKKGVPQRLSAVLRNWQSSLRQFPALLRALIRPSPDGLGRIFIERNALIIEIAGPPLHFTYGQTEYLEIAAELAAIANNLPRSGRDIRLIFGNDQILHAALRLPMAPPKVLRQAIQYELPRVSPIDPKDLYFDFTAKPASDIRTQTDIALHILRREQVDRIIATCHAAGLRIAAIGFHDSPADATAQHFPIDRNARWRLLWRRWGTLALCVLAIGLVLGIAASFYTRGTERLSTLEERIVLEQRRATAVMHLDQATAATKARAQFLNRQKAKPLLVAVLAGVTRTLPDGTWLTDIRLDGDMARIQGYSQNASDLIGQIDAAKLFRNAKFEAPVVQGQKAGTERFDISFTVGAGK